MSIFRIVWKNIRQRSLASMLTIFSIMLGVALVVSILILKQESSDAFNQYTVARKTAIKNGD